MEDIDGIYRWVGPPLKDDSVTTSFPGLLVQFKVHGKSRNDNLCLFVIGCKVLVRNGKNIPYIGEIVELYYDKVKKKMLTKLRWFYRYHEAKIYHQFTHSPPRHEIFYSSHYDINEVTVLESPCYVIFLPEKQPLPLSGKRYQNTFICRYELTFPGVSTFNNSKLRFEIERDFTLFPLQLQHLLFNDRKFWLYVESITETLNVSYQFSPRYDIVAKVDSTEIISDMNYKKVQDDSTNVDEKIILGTSVRNNIENFHDRNIDDDLYFSSQIPPTKIIRVRPFDINAIDGSLNVQSIAAEENSGLTSEIANISVSGTSATESSTNENGLKINRQKGKGTEEDFPPLEETLMHDQDSLVLSDSLLQRPVAQSQHSTLLEEDSDANYFFENDEIHSKNTLLTALPGSLFDFNSPKTDLSSTTYLTTPNKAITHTKSPRANSMEGSLLDLIESDSSGNINDNNEQHHIDNAVNNIPPCLPLVPMKDDLKSDTVWTPCEVIYLNGVDISFALDLLIQPIVQSVLLSSLKQFQQNSGTSSHRLIVDGSLAMLTGADVYGLFYETLYQQLPNRNIIELQPVLYQVLDQLKVRLLPFVTIWSVQEQDLLYTLCRTPERLSHIISLPLRRAQQKLLGKSRKEIIDFFAKYIDNGRYLDIVLNHEGFAYHLIHSDLTLEDALALSHSDEHNHTNYKRISDSHGIDSSSQLMYSLEDSICSVEDERWRRTIYWAKCDKEENPAMSQVELYGFKLWVVDSLMAQLQTGTRRKVTTASGQCIFPYLSMAEFAERNTNENAKSKSNSETNEILSQNFFLRIAAILDEFSFHQFRCTLLLWQRTCITIGAMAARVSHIIADAIVEDEEVKSIPVHDVLGRYRLIRNLKRDLYLQFKTLISSTSIQQFQLPHFDL